MSKKPDDTASYGEKKERSPRSLLPSVPMAHDSTKPGLGVDRRRPPQRIDAGTRTVGRAMGVALAMSDPFQRASIARALVLAGCGVEIVSSYDDVPSIDLSAVEILVADFDANEVFAIVDALREVHPDLPVVAWTARKLDVQRGLATMKFGKYEVLDRGSRMPDLIEALRRLTGGASLPPGGGTSIPPDSRG